MIVVANNCNDDTVQRCLDLVEQFPFELIIEVTPVAGLGNARNMGIEKAKGDLLVFLDDDMTVPTRYLEAYSSGVVKYPEVAVFAGRIKAIWSKGRPWWYPAPEVRPVDGIAGTFDLPQAQGATTQIPFGGNMAIRKSALNEHRFPGDAGMHGESMGFGEESLLVRELLNKGQLIAYLPEAVAHHHLQKQFESHRYIIRRLGVLNQALVRMGFTQPDPLPSNGVIKQLFKRLRWWLGAFRRLLLARDTTPLFYFLEQRARRKAANDIQVRNGPFV